MNTRPAIRPGFDQAAFTASRIGTWEYDIPHDRFRCDAPTAVLYGLTPEDAASGVPIQRARAAIHPDDQARASAKRQHVQRHGGLYVVEYRTVMSDGSLRWVLARGAYEPNPDGTITCGRGIVIDVTDSKSDGYAEGRAHFVAGGTPDPLEHAADLALALRDTVLRTGVRARVELVPRVDGLLFAIGCCLAAHIAGHDG